jgi:hypothetical protein
LIWIIICPPSNESPGWGTTHPRIQLLTVGDLLLGRARVDMPPSEMTFKTAGRVKGEGGAQKGLFD